MIFVISITLCIHTLLYAACDLKKDGNKELDLEKKMSEIVLARAAKDRG